MKLFLFILLTISAVFANSQKEILLLHSYNKGLKWSDGISKGVEDVFKNYPNYEITTEYMDSKKIDSKEYFDSLIALYEKKFATRKYEVVIVADNYAFEFALKNQKKLFNDSYIVFCGVENFKNSQISISLKDKVTGVIEYKEIKKNIELIKSVIENLSTLYIISDDTFSSLSIKEQILQDAKEFEKEFKIIYDNQIDLNTLNKKLDILPKNSAVLFTSLYKDKFGRYIPYNELRTFFNSSKYPIFALNKIHLGEGVVGGMMINPYEQGVNAANKAYEIISGKKVSQIEISKPTAKYYFDYEILQKYNIDKVLIPNFSTLINTPQTFFEKNREFIDSTFVMIPLLILLIIGLIITVMKKTKLELELLAQRKKELERKKNEQFLIQRTKLSEIGEMMTSIAHQWKTPLIEISTIAQELLYKKKKNNLNEKDAQEFVDDIMTQVKYMTNTIDDFRKFIKPSISKSEFSVRDAIKELLSVVEHGIKYNYIEIELLFENDEDYIICGYPNEFKQAILSIINNAKDSVLLRKDEKSFAAKIVIKVFNKDDLICISIKDNGIGIKKENLKSIFEPFFSSKKDGDGFGLYMVKLIIEDKMGGKIEALNYDSGAHILISLNEKICKLSE